MKLLSTILILSLLSLSGCVSKSEREFLKKISQDSNRYETLRQTKKIILGTNKEDEAIVLITYCYNNECIDNKSNESFIISIQKSQNQDETEDNNKTKNENIIKSITLEGHKPILKKELSYNDLAKSIKSIIPKWFDNYLVVFPHTKLKKFRLIITTQKNGTKKIYFYKVRRYRIDKPKSIKII